MVVVANYGLWRLVLHLFGKEEQLYSIVQAYPNNMYKSYE